MRQITVKRAVDAWHWIANNPHHIAGHEYPKGGYVDRPKPTHFFLQNYHEKLRVPFPLAKEVLTGIMPNRRKFDTRMYALRKHARLQVTK